MNRYIKKPDWQNDFSGENQLMAEQAVKLDEWFTEKVDVLNEVINHAEDVRGFVADGDVYFDNSQEDTIITDLGYMEKTHKAVVIAIVEIKKDEA